MREFIIKLAKDAGKLAAEMKQDASLDYKGYKNLVTEADKAAEKLIIEAIKEKYPHNGIISEESEDHDKDAEHVWVIDPIDGTANYAHGLTIYAVSIALMKNGVPQIGVVYAPELNELYFAKRGEGAELNEIPINVSGISTMNKSLIYYDIGIKKDLLADRVRLVKDLISESERVRGLGSFALEICSIAAGRGEGQVKFGDTFKIWDHAAADLILEEAGGKITDFHGRSIGYGKASQDVIISNNKIHAELMDFINQKVKKNE